MKMESLTGAGAAQEGPLIPLAAAIGIAFGVTVLLVTVFNYASAAIAVDLGLSAAQTAGALSLHLAVLIVALPLAGALADRYGARNIIIGSALTFGIALAAIAQVSSGPGMLYLAFALAGVAGAGASPISYNRVIVYRYHRHRGLALGVALSGTGLGGMLLPWIVRPVIVDQGWRPAFLILAGLATAAGLFAALLAGNERPPGQSKTGSPGVSLTAAAKTLAFWQMGFAFCLLGVAIAGFMAQLTTIFAASGLDQDSVPAFHTAIGAATILGRLAGGALMDKVSARWVGAGAAVLGALGIAAFALGAQSSVALIAIGGAVGLCTGAESDVVSYLASRYYGIRNFARIYALQGSIFMVGLASGPLLGALALEKAGLEASLFGGAALLLASALLLIMLRAPILDLEPAEVANADS